MKNYVFIIELYFGKDIMGVNNRDVRAMNLREAENMIYGDLSKLTEPGWKYVVKIVCVY